VPKFRTDDEQWLATYQAELIRDAAIRKLDRTKIEIDKKLARSMSNGRRPAICCPWQP
jgi:hypothetical protein